MIQEDRALWKYIVFGILTCGIYGYYFIYQLAMDVNEMCADDGKKTSGLAAFILLSFLTCGIYAWFWYYSLGNRLQENAPRYGLNFSENGTSVLLWLLLGSWLCGIGIFVAIHILIKNTNALAKAYNGSASGRGSGNGPDTQTRVQGPDGGAKGEGPIRYCDAETTALPGIPGQPVRGILYFVDTQETVAIDKEEFKIGKNNASVDYAIAHSTSVSRQHAAISRRNGQFTIVDLGSTNGTFVNDNRISGMVRLQDGDNIRFADVICVFNIVNG